MTHQNTKDLKEASLIEIMKSFEQTKGQTIYQHGLSVWEYAKRICSGDFEGMKIPLWLQDNFFQIVNQITTYDTLKRYCIYHDCGKPFCIHYDDEGKPHFPNHAKVSAEIYERVFPEDKDGKWLTENDMAIHSYTSEQIKEICETGSKELCLTLIISAFAELHSNAAMFGGIESTSFKIKWKKINQRSKQIFKHFIGEDKGAKYYSYIILRRDMETSHRLVQASHAAMEMQGYSGEKHPSIICIEVRNEHKLKSVASKLIERGIQFKTFREGAGVHEGEITALCTTPIKIDCPTRQFFLKYQLAR